MQKQTPQVLLLGKSFITIDVKAQCMSFYLFHSKKPLYFPTICSEYIIHFDSLKLSNMKIRIKNIKLRQECKFAENGTKVWNYSKSRQHTIVQQRIGDIFIWIFPQILDIYLRHLLFWSVIFVQRVASYYSEAIFIIQIHFILDIIIGNKCRSSCS